MGRTSPAKTPPFDDFGGSAAPLVFLHANGYPPACYQPLLEEFAEVYRVVAMHQRPLWPGAVPEEIDSWLPLSDDLLQLLAGLEAGAVIGVGHSLGAIVTLRAALREPSRFRALILIDPVLFTPLVITLRNLARWLRLKDRIHPRIQGALRRRRTFDDLELAFRGYRSRPVFRYMSDAALRTYLKGITHPAGAGGHELAYSPEWEARIYATGIWPDMDLWRGVKALDLPCLFIRGAESDTFRKHAARRLSQAGPRVRVEVVPQATHLVALERPRQVFDLAASFLKEQL